LGPLSLSLLLETPSLGLGLETLSLSLETLSLSLLLESLSLGLGLETLSLSLETLSLSLLLETLSLGLGLETLSLGLEQMSLESKSVRPSRLYAIQQGHEASNLFQSLPTCISDNVHVIV